MCDRNGIEMADASIGNITLMRERYIILQYYNIYIYMKRTEIKTGVLMNFDRY